MEKQDIVLTRYVLIRWIQIKSILLGPECILLLMVEKHGEASRANGLFTSNFGDNRSSGLIRAMDVICSLVLMEEHTRPGMVAKTMNHYYHIPLGEVYMVEVDNQQPYNVYFGFRIMNHGKLLQIAGREELVLRMW